MSDLLDLTAPLPRGRLVIEASAGTGKTYSLSALVVRHVAERSLPASSLLVVTFTKAAAAELRDRTRRALVEAVDAIDTRVAPSAQPWMSVLFEGHADDVVAQRRRALADAITSFDDATITTIHGFCQQALRQLGLRSGTPLQTSLTEGSKELIDEVCRDLVVATLAGDRRALQYSTKPIEPITIYNSLVAAVGARLGNPGAVVVPSRGAVPGKGDSPERLDAWLALVDRAVDAVAERRRARQQMGFDDLVTGLRDAVHDEQSGPAVVAALNDRYELVLIDEFQDTDAVQWDIFGTVFGDNGADLVTVGDPKQAIYRFRGADVHAYLEAVASAPTVRLGTNYRSDADLVAATSSLLDGVELGDPRIAVSPVVAAPGAAARSVDPGVPFQIRHLPRHPSLLKKGSVPAPLARRAVVADLVATTVDLLEHHTVAGRRVQPSDIAVLVHSHSTAEEVVRALAEARVPAVRTKTGSVLETEAYPEWRLLLAALEQPSRAALVRAACLGVFLNRSAPWLDPADPESELRLAEDQQRCARWSSELSRLPFLSWYDVVRAESQLVATLLSQPGGERRLTDLDHVAEVLGGELLTGRTTAASALRTLDQMADGLRDSDTQDREGRMRRIDSDASAVQVTTVHSSKGLEYPIVLLPFSWSAGSSGGPVVYHHDGERVLDVASQRQWSDPLKGKDLSSGEALGDQLRLLYVGLTRAEHRTVLWCAPHRNASALTTMLFDRSDDGTPTAGRPPTAKAMKLAADEAELAALETLAARSGSTLEVRTCPAAAPAVRWSPPIGDEPPALGLAPHGARTVVDPTWRRWSFTAVTRGLHDAWSPDAAHALAPVVGGADEPAELDALDDETVPAVADLEMPWRAVRGGASFGTLVHEVLERVDPTSAALEGDLAAAVDVQLRRDRIDVDPTVVVTGLAAAIRTPLGPIADGLRLGDLAPADRLAEMTFDLPLCDTRVAVSAADIGSVLLATLPADDPMRAYGSMLAEGRFDVDLAGYLQGSIDAVLRIPDAEVGHRYVVVDYKTNRLEGPDDVSPLAAYHPDRLPDRMMASDYVLQALLYSVALHRYLRWRLRGYDPARHLGGIAYLYLRGMVGPDTPTADGRPFGVMAWWPPVETILGLDRLLSTGVAR